VPLERQGDYVEFTLSAPSNALTVRYALPANHDIIIRHNTVIAPILANGLAISRARFP